MRKHATSVTLFGPGALGGAMIDLVRQNNAFTLTSVWGRKPEDCIPDTSERSDHPKESAITFPVSSDQLGELILLTVPDDSIELISNRLLQSGLSMKGKSVVHMSGSRNNSVLNSVKEAGAQTASLHPLQSFTKGDKAGRFEGIWFTLQGDEALYTELKCLVDPFSAGIIPMTAGQKSAMHLAAVFASNYLVSLMDLSGQITSQNGIKNGLDLLKPIVHQTIEKIFEQGTEDSLSGPVVRGDLNTLRTHLQQLDKTPQTGNAYRILGSVTADLSERSGRLSKKKAEDIRRLLERSDDE